MNSTDPSPSTDPAQGDGRRFRRWLQATAAVVGLGLAFGVGVVVHRQLSAPGPTAAAGPVVDELEATGPAPAEGPVSDDPPPPPPPDGSTRSFLVSTPRVTIDPDLKAHTFAESCPAGWYVRPGQGSAPDPVDVNPAYIELASSRYIDSEGDSSKQPVIPNAAWSIFTAFTAKFTNAGISSKHEVQLQYWCDKIPDWYTSASLIRDGVAKRPLGIAKSTDVRLKRDKGGIGPVPYGCFYCNFDFSSLTNASTGLALDSSNAGSGGPLIVQNPGGGNQEFYLTGQPGGSAFRDNIATFGLWRYRSLLDYAIAENADGSVSFINASSGEPPTNGDWYFVDHGAGMAIGGVQLINTATQHCLAASGGAGSQVVATGCDATDKSQYWIEPKS